MTSIDDPHRKRADLNGEFASTFARVARSAIIHTSMCRHTPHTQSSMQPWNKHERIR
jgi:hypothetical protein